MSFSNPDTILEKLGQYNLQGFSHTDSGLASHLKGTYEILKSWNCPEALCIAGLCHSIYGTESYRQNPIEISERNNIKSIIGDDAESMAYIFGAHTKESLWGNLKRNNDFKITDRLTSEEINLSKEQLNGLITLTLGNWLEQRSRAPEEYKFVRQDEFLASEEYLPTIAFKEFKIAYNLGEQK